MRMWMWRAEVHRLVRFLRIVPKYYTRYKTWQHGRPHTEPFKILPLSLLMSFHSAETTITTARVDAINSLKSKPPNFSSLLWSSSSSLILTLTSILSQNWYTLLPLLSLLFLISCFFASFPPPTSSHSSHSSSNLGFAFLSQQCLSVNHDILSVNHELVLCTFARFIRLWKFSLVLKLQACIFSMFLCTVLSPFPLLASILHTLHFNDIKNAYRLMFMCADFGSHMHCCLIEPLAIFWIVWVFNFHSSDMTFY